MRLFRKINFLHLPSDRRNQQRPWSWPPPCALLLILDFTIMSLIDNTIHREDEQPAHQTLGQFFLTFFRARGSTAIVLVTLFVALGTGCTVGITPEVMADRYARLEHNYTGPACSSLTIKPMACQQGTDDAQAAASYGNLALSLNALLFSPLVGSHSDRHGRRPMIITSVAVLLLPSVTLCAVLLFSNFHPVWYYLSNSVMGAFNYMSLVFAALADVFPQNLRAPSNGIFMAVWYAAFSLSPSLPLVLDHNHVALTALVCIAVASGVALYSLPETRDSTTDGVITPTITDQQLRRPWTQLAILGRNKRIALLAATSFAVSMAFAADHTLVLYYIEDRLNVGDTDIARMFLLLGVVGLLLNCAAIQPLQRLWGAQGLLLAALVCGSLHNTLYGLARSKTTIYAALVAAQFTKLNAPVLAALASQGAAPLEQGRIQGALAALNALGFSVGPLSMEFIYHKTKNKPHLGPGFMFYYGAMLYAAAVVLVLWVPSHKERTVVGTTDPESLDPNENSMEEPLLRPSDSESNHNQIGEDEG